jgi:hypothetical protein
MRSMRTPILRSTLYCRSLLGCGFLFFGWAMPAWAQREVEVQFSGGISLTQPAIKRQNLPRNFRTPADINTAAALRVTFPISYWVGLGVEQRVTGLSQIIACRLPGLGRSTGIMSNTVHQSGISLRLYDLWTPGPKWGLDVALTGSYGWTSTPQGTYEGPLFYEGSVLTQPTRTVPLMLVRETNRKGGPMVGLEALLRYEWGLHHSLLLTATYQRGIQYYDKIRSTLVAYVDETGAVQQGGSFVLTSRAAYGSVQLGYGLRLGTLATTRNKHPTPRYSIDDEAEDAQDDSPIN